MTMTPVPDWLSWPIALVLGFVIGIEIGRLVRMRFGWVAVDFRSLLRPLLLALALGMALFMVVTLAAAALGYSGNFAGISFAAELTLLFTVSTRFQPIEPWWQFWRWARPSAPAPPRKNKKKKRRKPRRHA
jgi:hypothetical protein